MKIKELREQRAKLISDMRALVDRAEAENRNLNDDEKAQLAKLEKDALDLRQRIDRLEQLEAEEQTLRQTVPASQRVDTSSSSQSGEPTYQSALNSYLRYGMNGLQPEERAVLQKGYHAFSSDEARAMSTLTGAGGGFTVAPDTSFYGRIVEAQKAWGGMFRAGCTEINTGMGNELPIPANDDTSNAATIVGETGSHASGTDLTFTQSILRAHMYTTKIVKVSFQLLQDSSIDIEAFLARAFGVRLGRGQNAHLTTGTGAGQPQGAVTGSTQGYQSATGFTTSVAADDLFQLYHSVNEAYRANARFMFSDATALKIRLLKDGDGQYIWKSGLTEDRPTTLLGKPVVINDDMATMAASAKHTLFGDFSAYHIRRVRGITVVRLNELYVENGQVGFVAFQRLDGALVNAGTNPLKHLANSAS